MLGLSNVHAPLEAQYIGGDNAQPDERFPVSATRQDRATGTYQQAPVFSLAPDASEGGGPDWLAIDEVIAALERRLAGDTPTAHPRAASCASCTDLPVDPQPARIGISDIYVATIDELRLLRKCWDQINVPAPDRSLKDIAATLHQSACKLRSLLRRAHRAQTQSPSTCPDPLPLTSAGARDTLDILIEMSQRVNFGPEQSPSAQRMRIYIEARVDILASYAREVRERIDVRHVGLAAPDAPDRRRPARSEEFRVMVTAMRQDGQLPFVDAVSRVEAQLALRGLKLRPTESVIWLALEAPDFSPNMPGMRDLKSALCAELVVSDAFLSDAKQWRRFLYRFVQSVAFPQPTLAQVIGCRTEVAAYLASFPRTAAPRKPDLDRKKIVPGIDHIAENFGSQLIDFVRRWSDRGLPVSGPEIQAYLLRLGVLATPEMVKALATALKDVLEQSGDWYFPRGQRPQRIYHFHTMSRGARLLRGCDEPVSGDDPDDLHGCERQMGWCRTMMLMYPHGFTRDEAFDVLRRMHPEGSDVENHRKIRHWIFLTIIVPMGEHLLGINPDWLTKDVREVLLRGYPDPSTWPEKPQRKNDVDTDTKHSGVDDEPLDPDHREGAGLSTRQPRKRYRHAKIADAVLNEVEEKALAGELPIVESLTGQPVLDIPALRKSIQHATDIRASDVALALKSLAPQKVAAKRALLLGERPHADGMYVMTVLGQLIATYPYLIFLSRPDLVEVIHRFHPHQYVDIGTVHRLFNVPVPTDEDEIEKAILDLVQSGEIALFYANSTTAQVSPTSLQHFLAFCCRARASSRSSSEQQPIGPGMWIPPLALKVVLRRCAHAIEAARTPMISRKLYEGRAARLRSAEKVLARLQKEPGNPPLTWDGYLKAFIAEFCVTRRGTLSYPGNVAMEIYWVVEELAAQKLSAPQPQGADGVGSQPTQVARAKRFKPAATDIAREEFPIGEAASTHAMQLEGLDPGFALFLQQYLRLRTEPACASASSPVARARPSDLPRSDGAALLKTTPGSLDIPFEAREAAGPARIRHLLQQCEYPVLQVPGNGNCFFNALALYEPDPSQTLRTARRGMAELLASTPDTERSLQTNALSIANTLYFNHRSVFEACRIGERGIQAVPNSVRALLDGLPGIYIDMESTPLYCAWRDAQLSCSMPTVVTVVCADLSVVGYNRAGRVFARSLNGLDDAQAQAVLKNSIDQSTKTLLFSGQHFDRVLA